MNYYLDTNTCIYFLKGKNQKLKSRILSENPVKIKIPSIVKAELLYGVEKSKRKEENLNNLNMFLFPLEVVGFNDYETIEYAKIRSYLERKGEVIGPNDMLIAAIIKANDGILITNNVKEFEKVKDLKIENWC